MKQLTSFKDKFDAELFVYLDKKEKDMKKLDPHGGEMASAIKTFLSYGGKRFRPALFFYTYNSFAEKKEIDSLVFSFVFELFHTFALIHDDIIDNSNLRRGNPSIHIKYGLQMGVLAGDFALTLVDELYLEQISQESISEAQKLTVHLLFNKYKQELLVGQYLDSIHSNDREKIMKLKTADYSFVKPVEIALLLARVDNKIVKKWKTFFIQLGIAFQLKDDYLGVFVDEKKTGKSCLSDTQEGKNTHIVELFKKRASKEELAHFNLFFGKSTFSTSQLEWYRGILEDRNVKQDIVAEIQTICCHLQDEILNSREDATTFHTLIKEIITHINIF